MKYYFLLSLSYDGYGYNGWSKQQDIKTTIQGNLEHALSMFCQSDDFNCWGASRTDSHVHAIDQKVKVELSFLPDLDRMIRSLNKILPIDIRVTHIELTTKDFNIRGAVSKKYQYQIATSEPGVFDGRYYQYCDSRYFDFKKFKNAIMVFNGTHNFKHFTSLSETEIVDKEVVRTINSIRVKRLGTKIFIEFTSKGFLTHQIRRMVGASIAHAQNKIELQKIINVLQLREGKLDYTAEGKGLFLKKITY
ncbi:tRNA pseudouridine(38-40) synthase TruA [Spiroplasma endosymbiont of Othius punctulatus]|uniref:tRNA pseudouridine(38-40) synthase TruA n=1 Tax=Spiroplasma endosymbiont of Othius punctulatus TaxID=3066289 RepID=UPI0030CC63CC